MTDEELLRGLHAVLAPVRGLALEQAAKIERAKQLYAELNTLARPSTDPDDRLPFDPDICARHVVVGLRERPQWAIEVREKAHAIYNEWLTERLNP